MDLVSLVELLRSVGLITLLVAFPILVVLAVVLLGMAIFFGFKEIRGK